MRDFVNFSGNVTAKFDNSYDNMLKFNEVLMDGAARNCAKYSVEEASTIARNQFNDILGINFKEAKSMKRRQAWRDHGKEICSLMEDTLVDRSVSGWRESNAFFMDYVQQINLGEDDVNEFYVENDALLQVSEYAGNHHDICKIVSV